MTWQLPTENCTLLGAVQRHDLETTLADGLLTKADRASMAAALELRSPFLDKAVVEFAATLPVPERVRRLQTKVFLNRYAERSLPAKIVHRRKRGLSVPLSSWLRGPLHDWAESLLNSDLLSRIGIERDAAKKLFEQHCRRQSDHGRPLWALLVLCEWLRWAGSLK